MFGTNEKGHCDVSVSQIVYFVCYVLKTQMVLYKRYLYLTLLQY